MQMYLYVHEAILREVVQVEAVAKDLDRDDAEQVAALAARLTWFHTMVRAHENAEEQYLFPALEQRFRYVAEAYLFDHDDFEPHVFDGLDRALAGLARADGRGERTQSADLLYRQAVALNEHMRLHITKENELLLPKVETEFDVAEQVQLAGQMAGMFQPPLMGELVGWMYAGQNAEDRAGMVGFLSAALPPPVMDGLTAMLAAQDPTGWAETMARASAGEDAVADEERQQGTQD
jgi:hemerythrin-like domain-containing protein